MEARVDAYFANLLQNPEEFRALMEAYGPMPDALWDATERSYLPVLADPAFVPYVVRRMPEFLAMGLTEEQALISFAGLADTAFPGASRLSQKKTESFVRSIVDVLDWLRENSPQFCASMGIFAAAGDAGPGEEELAPFIQMVTTAMSTLDPERDAALFRFVALYAEAALAEIRGFPEARPLAPGPALAEAADAYRTAFTERMSTPGAEGVLRAFEERRGMEEMAAADICVAMALVFEALWDLPPDLRGTMLLAVLLAMSDPTGFDSIMGAY